MAHYKANTPKRHVCWSNSPEVRHLDLGKLHLFNYRDPEYQKHKTAKVTVSKTTGKRQFTGNKRQLKESQHFGFDWWRLSILEVLFLYRHAVTADCLGYDAHRFKILRNKEISNMLITMHQHDGPGHISKWALKCLFSGWMYAMHAIHIYIYIYIYIP